MKPFRIAAITSAIVAATLGGGCDAIQRETLFHPTHHSRDNGLTQWIDDGELIGYKRDVAQPRNVWLLLHGNRHTAMHRSRVDRQRPGFSAGERVASQRLVA